jgi:succinate-acetate transporter protein
MTLAFNWCLVKGETFSATVFGSFGGFYLSYGAILTPVSKTAYRKQNLLTGNSTKNALIDV